MCVILDKTKICVKAFLSVPSPFPSGLTKTLRLLDSARNEIYDLIEGWRKMKRIAFCLVAAIIVFGLAGGYVWAQATAQIAGTVRDQSGAVLPGVEVTV